MNETGDRDAALAVFTEAQVGYVAFTTPRGFSVVPVVLAHDGSRLYWHGGGSEMREAVAAGGAACVTAVSVEGFVNGGRPCDNTLWFHSATVRGAVRVVEARQDKVFALRLIMIKYDPYRRRDAFDEEPLDRALVYAMDLEDVAYEGPRRTAPPTSSN